MKRATSTALSVMICACGPTIIGSGREATDSRTVGAFKRVSIEDGLTATIRVGPRSFTLTGDDNALPYVETVNNGSTLQVRLKHNAVVQAKVALKVELTNNELEGIDASGAAHIDVTVTPYSFTTAISASGASVVRVDGIDAPEVEADATGASTIELKGVTPALVLTGSGNANIDSQSIEAATVEVDASGASIIAARATQEFTGQLSGASQLKAFAPAKVSVTTSGGSKIEKQ